MIKKILLSFFVLLALVGFTQIPNPGFESVSGGSPTGWNLGALYSPYPIRDTTAAHTGSYAAAIYGSIPPAYNGAVVQNFNQVSSLPSGLTGWYKFYPQGGDSILFNVEVWKSGNYATNAHNSLTATILTGTTSVWTQFSVTVDYTGYPFLTCDSAFISIYPTGNVSYGSYNWAHQNTKALFDDLAWTFTTTGVAAINQSLLLNVENVYPNPAREYCEIIYTLSSPGTVSLKLFDLTGKEVLRIIDQEKQGVGRFKAVADLKALDSGIYFYEFSTTSGTRVTRKLIKQ
jgi:hypothetical protein